MSASPANIAVSALRDLHFWPALRVHHAAGNTPGSGVVAACLRPPVYATRFHEGFGTVYTGEYRPAEGAARYHWPGRTWAHSLDAPGLASIHIRLGTP